MTDICLQAESNVSSEAELTEDDNDDNDDDEEELAVSEGPLDVRRLLLLTPSHTGTDAITCIAIRQRWI